MKPEQTFLEEAGVQTVEKHVIKDQIQNDSSKPEMIINPGEPEFHENVPLGNATDVYNLRDPIRRLTLFYAPMVLMASATSLALQLANIVTAEDFL